ncbi:DUF4129 domain-containing protein [Haloarcula onubensis]|uniref:DUF4129 domain-containing protein n=1 Tax=Haloarcula onubensis TaxID=2950539 RepID=A0ABU2FJQ9_9EURY|nr:DUF4129 domain-containing protein [Halomicroarcula sp. S3CR25-11]MDS0280994.1 DUF4129 domain-containing protein [Halomicroarcula sp. S3CR25-11]
MSRRPVLALVTLLTVLALVVGAPTLDGPVDGTTDSRVGPGQQDTGATAQMPPSNGVGLLVLPLLILCTAVGLGYGLRQYGYDDVVVAGLTSVLLTVAAVVAVASRSPVISGTFVGNGSNGSAAAGVTSGAPPPESLWTLGAVGSFVVVAVAGAVLLRGTGTETWSTRDGEERTEAADRVDRRTAVGDAAGRAADRLAAEAAPENAVYRAWREMTAALDVSNPAATTPGEFAAAAERAGMDADDVATLTDLFESVRYGDSAPTDERERRAERALRNIERAYGSES